MLAGFLNSRISRMGVVASAAIVAAAVAGAVVTAQEWPALQQGMWEIVRTMSAPEGGAPKTVTSKRCMDPSEEWKRQNASLAKAGCTFSPVKRSGNTYTFTSTCKMAGIESQTTTTITMESPTAYTMKVVGTAAGEPVKEEAKGRRIGDCAK